MTDPDARPDADGDESGRDFDRPRAGRLRVVAGLALTVAFLAAASVALVKRRVEVKSSLVEIGVPGLLLSLGFALAGMGLTYPAWRVVLRGLGVALPRAVAVRLFFLSQLGKYLPGAVWPAVMQMDVGRSRGASRRVMLAANVLTVVVSSTVGLALSCVFLPLTDGRALARYWWVLLAFPLLVGLLHPRAVTGLMDRAAVVLGRRPVMLRLDLRSSRRATFWSVASFLALGAHISVLVGMIGGLDVSDVALCVGGMALALSAGILFVPAPAGAGIRDVILVLVLSTTVTTNEALTVAVTSRLVLVVADVMLALLTMAATRSRAG